MLDVILKAYIEFQLLFKSLFLNYITIWGKS